MPGYRRLSAVIGGIERVCAG